MKSKIGFIMACIYIVAASLIVFPALFQTPYTGNNGNIILLPSLMLIYTPAYLFHNLSFLGFTYVLFPLSIILNALILYFIGLGISKIAAKLKSSEKNVV